jgi:hypothetical protein
MAVTRRPINNPVKGFDVAMMIVSAALAPRCCSEEIIRSRANRKMKSAARIKPVFRIIVFQVFDGGATVGCMSMEANIANGRGVRWPKQGLHKIVKRFARAGCKVPGTDGPWYLYLWRESSEQR